MALAEDLKIAPEVFQNPILNIHLKGFRLYGFVIGKNQNYDYWHYSRSVFFTFSILLAAYLCWDIVLQSGHSFESGGLGMATAILCTSLGSALLTAILQRKRVIRLIVYVHNDIKKLHVRRSASEDVIFKETFKYSRRMTLGLLIPTLICGAMVFIDFFCRLIFFPSTVFNADEVTAGIAEPILLFKIFPFREIHNNFVIGYFWPGYFVFLGMFADPLWHTFVVSLMCYVVLKFRLLSKRVETMDARLTQAFNDPLDQLSEFQKNFLRLQVYRMCAIEQNCMRWFVRELETLIKFPAFLDFIMFSFLICFQLYAVVTAPLNKFDYLFTCIYIFVTSSLLWQYHWHATLIRECNENFSFAIYSGNWYNYPVWLQKTALLIMLQSTRPLIIKTIFVELNIKTFVEILRASFSYFNILRQI